jgi:hypothetical protein
LSLAKNSVPSTLEIKKINYCENNNKYQYICENESIYKNLKSNYSFIFENNKINFIEKSVIFTLIEMSRRPDNFSPFSRLQIYLKYEGKSYYYDFRPKNLEDYTLMTSLKALDYLVTKFLKQKTLLRIASDLDSIAPKENAVSADLESFLRENKSLIANNEALSSNFIKGDDVLSKFETFNRINFKNLIQTFNNSLSKNDSAFEFNNSNFTLNNSLNETPLIKCNFNLSEENSQNDQLIDANKNKSHVVGFSENNNYFLAVSSSSLTYPLETVSQLSYFLKAKPSLVAIPMCEVKSNSKEIILFSNDGRNHTQHLQHLNSYGLSQIDNNSSLNDMLSFSRHLFLSNPERILYESKKGRKAQLDFFLEMNFPIYHVEQLGNIFGFANFSNQSKTVGSIHIDQRNKVELWCKE